MKFDPCKKPAGMEVLIQTCQISMSETKKRKLCPGSIGLCSPNDLFAWFPENQMSNLKTWYLGLLPSNRETILILQWTKRNSALSLSSNKLNITGLHNIVLDYSCSAEMFYAPILIFSLILCSVIQALCFTSIHIGAQKQMLCVFAISVLSQVVFQKKVLGEKSSWATKLEWTWKITWFKPSAHAWYPPCIFSVAGNVLYLACSFCNKQFPSKALPCALSEISVPLTLHTPPV